MSVKVQESIVCCQSHCKKHSHREGGTGAGLRGLSRSLLKGEEGGEGCKSRRSRTGKAHRLKTEGVLLVCNYVF